MRDEISDRLDKNLSRVRNLVATFNASASQKPRRVKDTDALRAATVFLHATLEDFLRSIAAWKLPVAPAEVLRDIPLSGLGRSTRFTLADLVEHRNRGVEELIRLSVDEYLERSNYNSTTDVSTLLRNLGIAVNKVDSTFPDLSQLMERRHQIVHRVDRTPGTGKAAPLDDKDVNRWISAVERFTSAVLNEILD